MNKCGAHDIPSFSKDSEFAKDFCKWLISITGGSRPENQADQIVSRALKFFKSVTSDDLSFEEVTDGIDTDFYLGSGRNISDFIENLESKTGMGHSGQLATSMHSVILLIIENTKELPLKFCKTFQWLKCFFEKHENVYQKNENTVEF